MGVPVVSAAAFAPVVGQESSLGFFAHDDLGPARHFYETEGYVVLRGLVAPAQCDTIMARFDAEVRSARTPILRQVNMRYEVNRFTADRFLANPIFNVQDLQTRRFGGFKRAVLDTLTGAAVAHAVARLLGGPRVKVVQSMFFEAPAGTWPHQDSYYQDSARGLGQAVAGWFALEDIADGAGRFYVCPGSHRREVMRNAGRLNFAGGHEAYKQAMGELIRSAELPVVAPPLQKGDVLLWNSLTVHGSFAATGPGVSRRSLTAHYLREDDDMLQFHTRVRHQRMALWNGMQVGLLHDQDLRRNRLVRDLAHRYPASYTALRRLALKGLLATRGLRGKRA